MARVDPSAYMAGRGAVRRLPPAELSVDVLGVVALVLAYWIL